MGNVEMHDLAPCPEDDRKELDLARKVNYAQYCKHLKGEYTEECLSELPWNIRDSISLFERLNVSFNCFSTLPPELPFRLPHLQVLNLNHNQITCLPESISLLYHLKELLLTYNLLTCLPQSFARLSKLEKLDLSHNRLRELPEDIGSMPALAKINVSHNVLKCLPLSLGKSETLKVLLANNNCCEKQPGQSICDAGSSETLKFLRELAQEKPVVLMKPIKQANVFPRVRGNMVLTSVPNYLSARSQYVRIQTETMNTASRIRTPLLPPYGATTFHADELTDHIVGLIYGAVMGDALGIATEFMTPDECLFHYDMETLSFSEIVCDEHRVWWEKGHWTSNSDQMFLVMDSLLHWAGVADELDFAERLLAWRKHGIPELRNKEGHTLSEIINLVLQEQDYASRPHQVAQESLLRLPYLHSNGTSQHERAVFADNGAISRAIILGIPNFHNLEEVTNNSIRICLATHADKRCQAASVALSIIIALILQGKHDLDSEESLEEMFEVAKLAGLELLHDEEHREGFNKYFECKTYESIMPGEKNNMKYVLKPLAAGLVAMRQNKDFKSSLNNLVMLGGHSSMNACVAGAFLGCRVGYKSLPHDWLDQMQEKKREWLNDRINKLLDMMGLP